MAAPVLVFDSLLPKGLADAVSDPCELLLKTVDDAGRDVILVDQDLALDWIRDGEDAGFVGIEEAGPTTILMPWSYYRSADAARLVERLQAMGATITIATQDGTVPASVSGVGATLPDDIEPLDIRDLGILTPQMMLNGLSITSSPALFTDRIGRFCVTDRDVDAVRAALQAHVATCTALYDEIPARALGVTLEGGVLFDDPSWTRAVIDALDEAGLHLSSVRFDREATPMRLLTAVSEIFRYQLLHPRRRIRFLLDGVADPLTAEAIPIFKAGEVGADQLNQLQALWSDRIDDEWLQRRLDDAPRRLVFEAFSGRRADPDLQQGAVASIGPPRYWIRALHNFLSVGSARLVVIPTWQCELRCQYCWIVKQDGRVMTERTLERSIELLLSADGDEAEMHFFGGEPFLQWGLLQHAAVYGSRRAAAVGKHIRFRYTTNGFALQEEWLDWLQDYDVSFQLSLDGDRETQLAIRGPHKKGVDTYASSPAGRREWFASRNIPHDLVQVVHPDNVDRMAENFRHLAEMGYPRIQVNYAIGAHWPKEAQQAFALGLQAIGKQLEERWAKGEDIELVNLHEPIKKLRTNPHPTVDWDGTVLGGMEFLYLPRARDTLTLGHLDDLKGLHRYIADGISDEVLFGQWYRKGTVENNQRVGSITTSFVRWMRERHPDRTFKA